MEKISPETLRDWLADPHLVILDARSPHAWEASRSQIPHARRLDPSRFTPAAIQDLPKDRKVVVY